ncbi:hypothetical protein MKJ04_21190 [Pontibacter sp. E15-1]|uniref:hypothetical protein n=1 Tax=Pontibacter sp. E15-1 TaxID=2919918 RepID=UPI001F4FCE80|nr:hypothetical protein [Pontibacter sp. E15-1]MCJ8167370.1 hypothetical protein [Pontibacter sp. E15-1]
MERSTWNNSPQYPEDRDKRNRQRDNSPSQNPDSYRGAYRFETDRDPRNQSNWNRSEDHADRNRNQGRSPDYNQDYNRNYNNDYNRNYNYPTRDHRAEPRQSARGNDRENFQDRSYGSQRNHVSQGHESVHDRIEDNDPYGVGNFNANYRPDTYRSGRGENYGNMAGSLSYGYDGSSNYNPDWNSRYDPLSGHRRSYHGNYETRHPAHGWQPEEGSDRRKHSNEWY